MHIVAVVALLLTLFLPRPKWLKSSRKHYTTIKRPSGVGMLFLKRMKIIFARAWKLVTGSLNVALLRSPTPCLVSVSAPNLRFSIVWDTAPYPYGVLCSIAGHLSYKLGASDVRYVYNGGKVVRTETSHGNGHQDLAFFFDTEVISDEAWLCVQLRSSEVDPISQSWVDANQGGMRGEYLKVFELPADVVAAGEVWKYYSPHQGWNCYNPAAVFQTP